MVSIHLTHNLTSFHTGLIIILLNMVKNNNQHCEIVCLHLSLLDNVECSKQFSSVLKKAMKLIEKMVVGTHLMHTPSVIDAMPVLSVNVLMIKN